MGKCIRFLQEARILRRPAVTGMTVSRDHSRDSSSL